jgi:hypothetical protein
MGYLTASVVLLTALVLVSLSATLASARTLKQLTATVTALEKRLGDLMGGAPGAGMYPLGVPVKAFEATTIDRASVSRDSLAGWTLVAAVSPDCHACHDKLPEFIAAAAAVPGGRDQVLVLIADSPAEPGTMAEQLRPAARVVTGPQADAAVAAFSVTGYPTFMWVGPSGLIEFAGHGVDLSVVPLEAAV